MPPSPLFTIITVCRNAERSIARTVESVLHQQPFGATAEHVVVDGASTDGTLQRLAAYPSVRVVSEPDSGIYDAMNKGVALAQGDYLGFLNADDWYEPDTLATVRTALQEAPQADIVHGDIRRWNDQKPVDVVRPAATRRVLGPLAMPFHHPACFVRRDLFARFGGFDTTYRIFGDFDWASRVVKGGAVLHYRPAVLTNFRIGGLSTVRCAVRERYRVFRATGATPLHAAVAAGYGCAAVWRNRLSRSSPR